MRVKSHALIYLIQSELTQRST